MASAEEVSQVRLNVNEPTADPYTDEAISALVDTFGTVEAATVEIWRQKVARASELVDVSEGSARRSMSQVFTNMTKMLAFWEGKVGADVAATNSAARVHIIDRS